MTKYSKYRLSLMSLLLFSLTFGLSYFSDYYQGMLADSLEAMDPAAMGGEQVSVVSDLQIENVVDEAQGEVVVEGGGGESAEGIEFDGIENVVETEGGGVVAVDELVEMPSESSGGSGVDVGVRPVDPIVVENPSVPLDCQLMMAGAGNLDSAILKSEGAGGGGFEGEAVNEGESLKEGAVQEGDLGGSDIGGEGFVEESDSIEELSLTEELLVPAQEPSEVQEVAPEPVSEAVSESPPAQEQPVMQEAPPVDAGVSADEVEVQVQSLSTEGELVSQARENAHTPEECQKYLDVMKQNVPPLEVIPDIVEDDLIEREFSVAEVNEEMQMKVLKAERLEYLENLILDYYFEQHEESGDYKFMGNGVFYLRLGLAGIYEDALEEQGDDFYLLDQFSKYIEEKGLYYVDLVFTRDLDYDSLAVDNFAVESLEGERIVPNRVFAYKNEAVLLYESKEIPDLSLLKLDGVAPIKKEEGVDKLTGYYSLLAEDDDYIEVAEEAKQQYQAYLGDDITFAASKISFGEFNQYAPGASTVAINIGNAGGLSDQCAILVFGNDLRQEAGDKAIPAQGLRLITESTGGAPIDAGVIDAFEQEKSKSFVGFVYLQDLEILNEAYVLYLSLSVPPGLDKGAYRSDFSFEIFCPGVAGM